jgi:hypothetical protein
VASNEQIFNVRLLVKDPLGFNSIIEVVNAAALPVTPTAQCLYYVADVKEYQAFEDDVWTRQDIVVANTRVSTLIDLYGNENVVASKVINDLISYYGQQLALAYKSHDDGAESFDKNTLSDVLSFYKSLKSSFQDDAAADAGMNTGMYVRTKKQCIGGML